MAERGVAPVVGVTTMVLITVVLATLVGGMLFGVGVGLEDPPEASISVEAERLASGGTQVSLVHTNGGTLDVRSLVVRVAVDGEPLTHQPAVPATGMTGYNGTPNGPFNAGSADTGWSAGEVAGFEIAATTNAPQPALGDRVTVRLFVDGHPVAVVETTVS